MFRKAKQEHGEFCEMAIISKVIWVCKIMSRNSHNRKLLLNWLCSQKLVRNMEMQPNSFTHPIEPLFPRTFNLTAL